MTAYYSTQMSLYREIPQLMIPARGSMSVRCYPFHYTVPAGNIAAASTIDLNVVVGYGYLTMGEYWASAMSVDGSDSSISIGIIPAATRITNHALSLTKDTGSAAFFLGTTSVDALTSAVGFGRTIALGWDTLLYPGDIIYATAVTAAWVAAGVLDGYFIVRE